MAPAVTWEPAMAATSPRRPIAANIPPVMPRYFTAVTKPKPGVSYRDCSVLRVASSMMPSACHSATSSASRCFTSLDGTHRLYPVWVLPEIYERWFQELCGRPSPVETRSDCDRCSMLDPAEETPFNPETRCCTYHPHLAPHLVGALI